MQSKEAFLLRQTLRKYSKACNTVETADLKKKFSEQRNKYKNPLKEKKSEHKKKLILKTLEDSAMDSRKFWNTIKSATCKDASVQNTITTQEWFQYFYCVFNGDTVTIPVTLMLLVILQLTWRMYRLL